MKKAINIISIILIVAILVVSGYAIFRVIGNIQGYLAFSVVDQDGNLIKNTINNELIVDKTYKFSVNYTYPDKSENNNTDYNVEIFSLTENDFDYYVDDKGPISFNGNDYSKEFNLVKKDNTFEITIPKLDTLFKGALDKNKSPIYLGDIFDNDSFVLRISSYNDMTVIEYKFHFTNEGHVDIEGIEIGEDIIFESDNEDVYVPITDIEIDGGDIIFKEE